MVAGQKRDKNRSNKIREMKGIQRLASKLQRVSETGLGTTKDMSQVDRTVDRKIISHLASTLKDLDMIRSRAKNQKSKESVSLLYLNVMEIFNEYQKGDAGAYRSLLRKDGQVNSSDLNNLVDLDTDISLGINTLALTVSEQTKTAALRKSVSENITLGLDEIKADVRKRMKIIAKQQIRNKHQIH